MTMQFGSATEVSNMCGVTLMNTPVGRVVADVMGAKDSVELTEYPSMIRVDGQRVLDFDYAELTESAPWSMRTEPVARICPGDGPSVMRRP